MYIEEEFSLNDNATSALRGMIPQFGYNGFGEIVYYRSYSRTIRDDYGNTIGQEDWSDTVIRVINGVMSIRKDHYVRNRIEWDETKWQQYAYRMAVSMFRFQWLPPGRGLWAMGTDLVRQRGAMALYNCCFTKVAENWIEDLCWLMDSLMFGAGVGFRPVRTGLMLQEPTGTHTHVVGDSREGWCDALRQMLRAFEHGTSIPEFDYSQVRPFGAPISTFGGTASGPEPLKRMLDTIHDLCYEYCKNGTEHACDFDEVRFKTDLANLIGVCVVAGNVRRSAEIGLCEFDDPVFRDLKNLKKYPYRASHCWMSNNSVLLTKDSDFENLDEIANANIDGYDVGYLNMRNVKFGRLGKRGDNYGLDAAEGGNPCGEINLEHREVCNVADSIPTRCVNVEQWLEACVYVTFYCSTVALLPTHQASTNAVVTRNRRIGVGLMDFTGWVEQEGVAKVISYLRRGYNVIREENQRLAEEAGVPASIRVTTVKPGGTTTKLAGRTAGSGYPTFRYTLRRINIGVDTPIDKLLIEAGVPYEDSAYTPNTHVFEYPIEQGPARPATEVTLWEQAMNIVLLQREWSDNAVSNTLYFKPKWSCIAQGEVGEFVQFSLHGKDMFVDTGHPSFKIDQYGEAHNQTVFPMFDGNIKVILDDNNFKVYRYNPNHEEDQVADVLSHIAPLTKSVSLLPHSDTGIFKQMPEEALTKEEYERRLSAIHPIDWNKFANSDGEDDKYCSGDSCTLIK